MPRYFDDDDDDLDDIRISRRDRDYASRDFGFEREMPQSGMGISSLLIAIAVGLLMFGLFFMIIVMTMNGQPPPPNDPKLALLGMGILGGSGLSLVGLVLGICGSIQANRRGLCGILGSIFNGLILLGVGAVMCLGIVAGG